LAHEYVGEAESVQPVGESVRSFCGSFYRSFHWAQVVTGVTEVTVHHGWVFWSKVTLNMPAY